MKPPEAAAEFDRHAGDYDAQWRRGLSVSGEDREYFARERVAWFEGRLSRRGGRPAAVLDYGCGTGITEPFLRTLPGVARVTAVDPSEELLARASAEHPLDGVAYVPLGGWRPEGNVDLVYCSGVFHHVPPPEWPATADRLARALRPGGWLSFWENSPWSPVARYVMRRIPFDRDAVMISPAVARRMFQEAGFDVARAEFRFIFPRFLRGLRWLEGGLCRMPFGAQYHLLCRKRE
ncbi:MAG: methyltransferase domain-containing protein [Planctomycetota bacterium]